MEKVSSDCRNGAGETSSENTAFSRQTLQRVAADARISRLLAENSIVTRSQYDVARSRCIQRGGNIVDNLISLGYLAPAELVEFLVMRSTELAADVSQLGLSPELIKLIPAELARKYQFVPIERTPDSILLGAVAPLESDALSLVEQIAGVTPKVLLCCKEDIMAALNAHYPGENAPENGAPSPDEIDSSRLMADTKMSHVVHMIHQISSLPALPETVIRVQETMESPRSSVKDIVDILILDPPVAAKVLSVANSAAYGFAHRVNTLEMAVTLLGLRETYGIVLSAAIANLADKLQHFNYEAFWLESMYCAAAARIVAKAASLRQLTGVFSAALLHDIGRIVLLELQPNYAQLLPEPLWGKALVEEEKRVIGLSHPEAGYELAIYWNLPDEIAEVVRFHHEPEHADASSKHVAIVALANVMACATGESLEENAGLFKGYESTLEKLRLDSEIAEAMLDEFLVLRSKTLGAPDEQ